MLNHRQKIIQLADSSELGWRLVKEYEAHPIASDSDDEKRIFKAEVRATRKMKSEKSKRGRGSYRAWPYRRRRYMEPSSTQTTASATETKKQPGLCFGCSLPGHWKKDCPSLRSSNNKISRNVFMNLNTKSHIGETHGISPSNSDGLVYKQVNTVDEQVNSTCKIKDQGKGETVISHENVCVISPVGRLKAAHEKWKETGVSKYILSVIEEGYKLPFKTFPPSAHIKNNRSARENVSFVSKEIQSLQQKGVLSESEQKPTVVNPLTVAYNKVGKPRLVLDCRHINEHLHKFRFRYEDIRIAEEMFEKGSFLFTYDLKSAYHHIMINPMFRTYLGLAWESNGETKYYVFNCLPFGIGVASHIFSKTLRHVVKYLRSSGYKEVMFLDDGIGGSTDYERALQASTFVKGSLIEFGFLLANDKCNWMPVQRTVWLGHILDTAENKLYITEERIKRLEVSIDSAIFQMRLDKVNLLNVKVLAAFVGQVISMQGVLGKIVRLKTRELYKCILSRASWKAPVLVSKEAIQELSFWRRNASGMNTEGKAIERNTFFEVSLFSDASSSGYGGYLEATSYLAKTTGRNVQNNANLAEHCQNVNEESQATMSNEGKNCYEPLEQIRGANLRASPEMGMIMPPEVGNENIYSVNRKVGSNVSPEVDIGSGNFEPPEVGNSTNMVTKDCGGNAQFDIQKTRHANSICTPPEVGRFNEILDTPEVSISDRSDISGKTRSHEVIGTWSLTESKKSSTWREAEAIKRILYSNVHSLRNKRIKIFSDNKNVQSVLEIGSRKTDLQSIAIDVFDFCKRENMTIGTQWIPREMNQEADYLSKCSNNDDWSIQNWVFVMLDKKWGPHTVDRFASLVTAKCIRFNSKWCVPRTEGINAFDQRWSLKIIG